MRSFKFISLCLFAFWTLTLRADTFQLNDGRTLTGELLLSSVNDAGVQIKTGDGTYERLTWSEFAQPTLKILAQTPKIAPFVEPFIEVAHEERLKKTEVKITEPPRLALLPKGSLIGSLFGSSVGLVCLLLIYAANLYAAYEIASVRARPVAMVCGISAVAPIIGPVVFLCLPTHMQAAPEEFVPAPAATEVVTSSFAGDPAAAQHPSGLHFADQTQAPAPEKHKTEVFQRGQYTFNRRFIETKFSGFFGLVRRDAEKDLLLVLKTPRGEYAAHRISRIAANDMHVEIHKGGVPSEVVVPFAEIQEIQLKHKDA